MKKKIFSIFLVMVLCIGMTAGCKKNVGTSQDNAIAEEDDDSKEEAKSYRFGFSCITMENPYYITLEQALREAVEAQGSTLVTKDPALLHEIHKWTDHHPRLQTNCTSVLQASGSLHTAHG